MTPAPVASWAREGPRRTAFVLASMSVAFAWSAGSAALHAGWVSAAVIVVVVFVAYAGYGLRFRDGLLTRLVVMGAVAGVFELLADRWLVDATRTLVYAPDEPMLVRSPVYMPGAWATVVVPVGYLGWLFARRAGLAGGSVLCGILGAMYVPIYEIFAFHAGWWTYRDAPMLGHAPWYIVLGEGLFGLVLPGAVRLVERRGLGWSAFAGALVGLWIWPAYAIAYALVG